MNDELNNNPFEPLNQMTLSGLEKEKIRGNIRGFVALHRSRRWYAWFAQHVVASLIIALGLGGGSVLFAADRAAPDSALYGVRTTVNDQLRVAVVRDEDARIERELEVLGRYIEEEERLATRELSL